MKGFRTNRALLLICLFALALRLAALALVDFPGVADPNHYYNLGVRLAEGQGYTINYIWQYNDAYAQVTHPDDYWMPLTAWITAASMRVFGVGVHQALIPFILLGTLLPVVAYAAAGQLGVGRGGRLFAAAAAAALPELVLNSVRTDTTIPNALLTGAALILLVRGLRSATERPTAAWLAFAGSGAAAGLAYLTRSDSALILPMLVVVVILRAGLRQRVPRSIWLIPLIAVVLAIPWSLRNLSLNGTISTPTTANMFFLTDYRDHYVYDRALGLDHLLETQTPAQIIGKRLFEIAASLKLMITTLDVVLPVAVIGGAALILLARDREKLLTAAPALILLLGFFVFYTILAPYKSQGGSFKKAYLSLIPLLLPMGAYAFERAISDVRLRTGAMVLTVLLAAATAIDTVRLDAAASRAYLTQIETMASAAADLPDRSGDGALTLMTQDPFILGYAGLSSVMFPYESRDVVVEVARRYGVDYLLMPSDRPELDALLIDPTLDARFTPVRSVPGTSFIFYAVNDDAN